uniref:ABC-type nitrate/sulfonate/bicarbonate transport system, ATPase component n=1 Tax=Eubacterium cellulosolvens (strain ATCC 43171 / JCM 9499 / 6) TaxID=633697 RepID=I5AWZ0_EUBC6
MVELQGVGLDCVDGDGTRNILRDINLKIKDGECLSIVGSSGSGKTTLIKIIAGLKKPSRGSVRNDLGRVRGPLANSAFVFQDYGLFPWKTVEENIMLPLQIRHEKDRREKTSEIMKLLQIDNLAKRYPCQLSGGQKQRTAIGRALIGEYGLVLLDEPFSALDPLLRTELRKKVINRFHEKKVTSVMVTHDVEEAVLFGDRIAVFDPGGKRIRSVIRNQARRNNNVKTDTFRRTMADVKASLYGDVKIC